jgi:AraC-like DNA-binding protein
VLFAAGRLSHGGVEFAPAIALERSFRLFTVERKKSLWDTRFARAQTLDPTPPNAVYLLLDGWVRFHAPGAPVVHGPAALVSSSPPLDGPVGASKLTLTAGGEPFCAVQLSVDPAWFTGPDSGLAPIDASPAFVRSARDLFALASVDRIAIVAEFLQRCAEAGLVKPELGRTIKKVESPRFLRTWAAITEAYLKLPAELSRQEISSRVGVSERQLSRDVHEMLATFRVAWKSFRELSSDMRLRWAVLLLSSKDILVAEVARAAGYGSTDALDRALRDGGLPAPRELRRLLLAESGD